MYVQICMSHAVMEMREGLSCHSHLMQSDCSQWLPASIVGIQMFWLSCAPAHSCCSLSACPGPKQYGQSNYFYECSCIRYFLHFTVRMYHFRYVVSTHVNQEWPLLHMIHLHLARLRNVFDHATVFCSWGKQGCASYCWKFYSSSRSSLLCKSSWNQSFPIWKVRENVFAHIKD